MAEGRPQVGRLGPAESLRPQAQPVDPFAPEVVEAPTEELQQGGQLAQFGKALGQFNPSLQGLMNTQFERQREEDLRQAQADALKNRQEFKEVTREGLLREGHNPWYVHGYMKTKGRLKAQEAFQQAAVALENSNELAESTDTSTISGFLQEQFSPFLEGASQSELEGMVPELRRAESQLIQQHVSRVATRIERNRQTAMETELNQKLEGSLSSPGFAIQEGNESYQALLDFIKDQQDQYIADGGSPRDANDTVVRAVLNRARQSLNPDLPKVLKDLPAGTGNLGDITRYSEKIAQTRSDIQEALAQQVRLESKQRELALEQKRKQTHQQILQTLIENPMPGPEQMDQMMQQYVSQGGDISDIRSAQSALLDINSRENPMVVADIERQILQGEFGTEDILPAMAQGHIRSRETASRLMNMAQQYRESSGVLDHPLAEDGIASVRRLVAETYFTGGFGGVEQEAMADQAADEFRASLMEWASQQDNEYSREGLRKKVTELKDELIKFYGTEGTTEAVRDANIKALDRSTLEGLSQEVQRLQNNEPALKRDMLQRVIPPGHIDFLQQNSDDPQVIADFNEKYSQYGDNVADIILGD